MRNKIAIVGLIVAMFFVIRGLFFSSPAQVTLEAKSWNNGYVHVWSNLKEDETTTHADVPNETKCNRLDNEWYKSRYEPVIYYYLVNCNGVIGYVERDQAR